jgi:hypothetical protein
VKADRGRPSGQPSSTEQANGQHRPDRVSEGDAKVTRAGPLVDPTPWRARARSPSQTHSPSTEGE